MTRSPTSGVPREPDESEFGRVTWHSSEEDGGPDVGLMLGLGDGRAMWVGEISRHAHEEGGEAVAALGSDGGWWLMTYPGPQALAKFADAEAAREFFEQIAAAMRKRDA